MKAKPMILIGAGMLVAGYFLLNKDSIQPQAEVPGQEFIVRRSMVSHPVSPVGENSVGMTGRHRYDDSSSRIAEVEILAADLVSLAMKSDPVKKSDEEGYASLEFLEKMSRLDSKQFTIVIQTVKNEPQLDIVTKAEICGFLLPEVAKIDPALALELFSDTRSLFSTHEEILPPSKFLNPIATAYPAIYEAWRDKNAEAVHGSEEDLESR